LTKSRKEKILVQKLSAIFAFVDKSGWGVLWFFLWQGLLGSPLLINTFIKVGWLPRIIRRFELNFLQGLILIQCHWFLQSFNWFINKVWFLVSYDSLNAFILCQTKLFPAILLLNMEALFPSGLSSIIIRHREIAIKAKKRRFFELTGVIHLILISRLFVKLQMLFCCI